jgi:4-hydroxybenzoate polyprenyltransferase
MSVRPAAPAPDRPEVDAVHAPLTTTSSTWRAHVRLCRIDHWTKNVFVLPGIVIALSAVGTDEPARAVLNSILGLLATCLIASSNYVINELQDAPYDVHHPVKRHRPVPSGQVNVPIAYVQWVAIAIAGLGIAALVSWPLVATLAALWIMGCVYNIPPVRTKDRPYLDVLSEAVNNPLRLLAGWFMIASTGVPPLSALASYWMIGCYFMGIKRYAEYRDLRLVPGREERYRKSFRYYTEERLLVSIIFYASAAMLFLGAFFVRYRIELVLAFPVLAVCMAIYLDLAFQPNSPAEHPEKLYRQPLLMIAVSVCALLMTVLLFVDIPVMHDLFPRSGEFG